MHYNSVHNHAHSAAFFFLKKGGGAWMMCRIIWACAELHNMAPEIKFIFLTYLSMFFLFFFHLSQIKKSATLFNSVATLSVALMISPL